MSINNKNCFDFCHYACFLKQNISVSFLLTSETHILVRNKVSFYCLLNTATNTQRPGHKNTLFEYINRKDNSGFMENYYERLYVFQAFEL